MDPQRRLREHLQNGLLWHATLERLQERSFIDERSSRHVDQHRARVHRAQKVSVHDGLLDSCRDRCGELLNAIS